jgi:hypothetical protein
MLSDEEVVEEMRPLLAELVFTGEELPENLARLCHMGDSPPRTQVAA